MLRIREAAFRWRRHQGGAFAIYAALTLPILFATTGFAIDYWTTLSMKARLDTAADSAALAGVHAAVNYVNANPKQLSGQALSDAAKTVGAAAAVNAFKANASATLDVANVQLAPPNVTFDSSQELFKADVSYSGSRPVGFAGLVGLTDLPLNGAASAVQQKLTYVNVHILVDVSQSMGIAANPAEMARLYAITAADNIDGAGVGCVFACHYYPSTLPDGSVQTVEEIARKNNITLRIDVARAAISQIAKAAKTLAPNGNVNFAIYSMGELQDGKQIKQVYPGSGLTNKYDDVVNAMAGISVLNLEPETAIQWGDSNQEQAVSQFASQYLGAQGSGGSADSALNYVFVISDGVHDTPLNGRIVKAVDTTMCDGVKAKKATVGVIYTTYDPVYTGNDPSKGYEWRYAGMMPGISGMIAGNMKACATNADWYYEARDDAALMKALDKLFSSTVQQLRLTN